VSYALSVALCTVQCVAGLSAAEHVKPVFQANFENTATATAADGYPLHRANEALADLRIGFRIVRKGDGGRRPKCIREMPVRRG